jgi:hypothetical protein
MHSCLGVRWSSLLLQDLGQAGQEFPGRSARSQLKTGELFRNDSALRRDLLSFYLFSSSPQDCQTSTASWLVREIPAHSVAGGRGGDSSLSCLRRLRKPRL